MVYMPHLASQLIAVNKDVQIIFLWSKQSFKIVQKLFGLFFCQSQLLYLHTVH